MAVDKPVTNEEATTLARLFPPDGGFGLGFTLLHAVETSPDWGAPLAEQINEPEWRERALRRIRNKVD